MQAATRDRLARSAIEMGLPLAPTTAASVARYVDMLLDWNQRLNLTGARDEETLVDRHIVDCLFLAGAIPAGVRTVADVGSGAGLPGLVLALARPDLRVTVVESIQKKARFLAAARDEVPVPVEVLGHRMEDLRGRRFDLAVARAVYPPLQWVRRGRRIIAPDGWLVVMAAREPPPHPPSGLMSPRTVTYALPSGEPRTLYLYQRRHGPVPRGTSRAE